VPEPAEVRAPPAHTRPSSTHASVHCPPHLSVDVTSDYHLPSTTICLPSPSTHPPIHHPVYHPPIHPSTNPLIHHPSIIHLLSIYYPPCTISGNVRIYPKPSRGRSSYVLAQLPAARCRRDKAVGGGGLTRLAIASLLYLPSCFTGTQNADKHCGDIVIFLFIAFYRYHGSTCLVGTYLSVRCPTTPP